MRLYVDDDSVDPDLIRFLRRDGHDIQIPAGVGPVTRPRPRCLETLGGPS
jgi:hypothetical protein